jgi:hypothetical protein
MSDSTISGDPSVCQVRLEDTSDGGFVVSVPGTQYHLRLHPTAAVTTPVGRRLRGVIAGTAQKLHRAHAGGEFIEPSEGHPRIVQGRVRESDPAGNRLLVQAVVPMWITLSAGQSARDFHAGDFVNFYMESGVTFAPQA